MKSERKDRQEFSLAGVKDAIRRRLSGVSGPPVKMEKKAIPENAVISGKPEKEGVKEEKYILTGIPGFDGLFERGIPKGSAVLVAGGAGTGKTTFSLQSLYYGALKGEKGIYISFEEQPSKIKAHMKKNYGCDLY